MCSRNNISLIQQIVLVALGLLVLNCGRLSQNDVNDIVCDIDIKDTALVKSAIDSVYASDNINWPSDFDDVDTLDLVFFASIRAYIPFLDPDSMTKRFGPCVGERIVRLDDLSWYESDKAARLGWTKELGIRAELEDANYHMAYDQLIPTLSRIKGKFGITYKRWLFDDSHFIRMYYLSSDSILIPIDGDIIHKAHPAFEME